MNEEKNLILLYIISLKAAASKNLSTTLHEDLLYFKLN